MEHYPYSIALKLNHVLLCKLSHNIHFDFAACSMHNTIYYTLSYDIESGSEIKPCNKINKPLVVYRFTGNVMTSITALHTL